MMKQLNQFEPLKFEGDSTSYISPSWDEMNQLTYEVAKQVRATTIKYDRIITLAKGGWPMTRSLIDFTRIPQIASIGVKFYSGVNQKLDEPSVYQDVPANISNEKILLFDDVADTGESLIFTKKLLKQKGAAQVDTATVFYKPHSRLKPDFFGAQTSSWIVFPFEPFEMVELIGNKWLTLNISATEIKERFAKFNFTSEILEDAVNQLITSHKEAP